MIAQAGYAQTLDATKYYRIVSHLSNTCVDVKDFVVDNTGILQQWDCGPSAQPNQLWAIWQTSTGYRIVSAGSGKCADVTGASTANGVKLGQYTCELSWDQWNQVYTITPGPTPGYYHIASTQSGGAECWDVEGISSANGARIQQWGCGPLSNQEWQFVEASPRTPLTRVQTFGYHLSGSGSAWLNTQTHGNLGDVYSLADPGPAD